jgi:hypothetical protein
MKCEILVYQNAYFDIILWIIYTDSATDMKGLGSLHIFPSKELNYSHWDGH